MRSTRGKRKIRMLDVETVRKIAAGEVIERPVNVVKELVENSMDAGATEVIVELENGGKSLIRVSDDGMGMSADDLALAWQRHATSKITSIDDLDTLHTLGFRGEALYSIASVSRLRILSRPHGEEIGHELRVEAARSLGIREIACREGTIVEVRDLFFNVPVRTKFLRADSIELAKIHEFLQNFSLGYPEKKFVLRHDNKLLFSSPREKGYKEAILRVHGKRFTESLIEARSASEHWKLEAYLMLPRTRRNKKKYLLTFVNGRLVKSEIIDRAVKEGFKEFLVRGDQPVAMLFLTASPSQFDINIHPSKKEIAFVNPSEVHDLIKRTIEKRLHDALVLDEGMNVPRERNVDEFLSTVRMIKEEVSSRGTISSSEQSSKWESIIPSRSKNHSGSMRGKNQARITESTTSIRASRQLQLPVIPDEMLLRIPSPSGSARDQPQDHARMILRGKLIRIIGQLASSYLLLEDVETHNLIIADQHALDERRRLKMLMHEARDLTLKPHRLLAPIRLTLLPNEKVTILNTQDVLKQVGFHVFSAKDEENDILVEALPDVIVNERFSHNDLIDILLQVATNMSQNPKSSLVTARERLLRVAACRGAIKFGKQLSLPEIKVLLESIEDLRVPFICAHGRPSLLVLPIEKLHSLFRRKG